LGLYVHDYGAEIQVKSPVAMCQQNERD